MSGEFGPDFSLTCVKGLSRADTNTNRLQHKAAWTNEPTPLHWQRLTWIMILCESEHVSNINKQWVKSTNQLQRVHYVWALCTPRTAPASQQTRHQLDTPPQKILWISWHRSYVTPRSDCTRALSDNVGIHTQALSDKVRIKSWGQSKWERGFKVHCLQNVNLPLLKSYNK